MLHPAFLFSNWKRIGAPQDPGTKKRNLGTRLPISRVVSGAFGTPPKALFDLGELRAKDFDSCLL